MPHGTTIKPTHKAIQAYYAALQTYKDFEVRNEGALETAFGRLLADTGRSHGWTLLPKQPHKKGTRHIIPDGTFRDEFNLPRGYWEAKDTDDDLDAEIRKKIAKGYPLSNTIFEDTRQAVLFQNGTRSSALDLTDRQQLADLLNEFYAYTEPDIEDFEQAVDEFKDRIPDLARGLDAKIEAAHKDNKKFQAAFDDFFDAVPADAQPQHQPGRRRRDAGAAPADRAAHPQDFRQPRFHPPQRHRRRDREGDRRPGQPELQPRTSS